MDMPEAERRLDAIENRMTNFEQKLDKLPDIITTKLSETMDLKIVNAIQGVKIEFFKWIVPLCIGTIGALIGVIFQYVK